MIDKSQTAEQIEAAFGDAWLLDFNSCEEAIIKSPDVLVYAIGDCPTCKAEGVDLDWCRECGDEYTEPCPRHENDPESLCPDCNGTGKERVWVIPEAEYERTLAALQAWQEFRHQLLTVYGIAVPVDLFNSPLPLVAKGHRSIPEATLRRLVTAAHLLRMDSAADVDPIIAALIEELT